MFALLVLISCKNTSVHDPLQRGVLFFAGGGKKQATFVRKPVELCWLAAY